MDTRDPAAINCDLLIVGAGPVGLFGAYYAGFRGLRVAVVDSLSEVGGQVAALYPEKELLDIAGFPAIKGRDLIARLQAQADHFEPVYVLGHQAKQLERRPTGDGTPEDLVVTTSRGLRIVAKAIVITGGIGTFTPRRLPAGWEFEERGLAYFVPEPGDYADADVVIVGGGDSAFDWAVTLHPLARSVTIVHRRDTFRAHEATVAAVRDLGVPIITNAEVKRVSGNGWIEAVEIEEAGAAGVRSLPCQRLVAALGFTANLGPLRDWGLELAHNRHIIVDSAMRTRQPGVFAAGDITEFDGKVRLIAVGFGEAALAVNHAAIHIDPGRKLFPGHSTDPTQQRVAAGR
ncbi:NAD(P)/FAD-dependent oxidoreductase [Amycolatopsis methanolica]|uniref:Ferredoxin--NADP reductase n=1 Tax=Amycolatopsis methanolica 239 TaxID=1068978 RepID=A0A076MKL6_AMYME|nr:NAD(P)/FAD-dependent oxidoreductase [Amycolatopsis methanolica]AIJ21279.1 pyridine nucleotide-disulfide oxidoreductase [Amycolatopsis methanolica 239]